MNNEIVFCIPSYKRGTDKVSTLEIIPNALVFVDEDEAEQYKVTNDGAEIISVEKGVQGNLCRIRNYILDYCFNNGAFAVVILDDDINCFYKAVENENNALLFMKMETDEILNAVQTMVSIADNVGAKMFGVNPSCTDKLSFRENTPYTFLNYIGGPFQGFLNNPIRYDERLPLKEDYDITLQHLLKYRRILRCEFIRYRAKMHNNSGGCATYRGMVTEKKQFDLLQKKWGANIIKIDKKSKAQYDLNPILRIPLQGI